MNRWSKLLFAAALIGAVASPSVAADCVRVSTDSLQTAVQGPPAVPFTAFHGTVELDVAGQTVECAVQFKADPLRSTSRPSGQMFTFGEGLMDFGPMGKLEVWEVSRLTPTDRPGVWKYFGVQKGAGGTGAFKNAHATFRLRGLIYLTGDPADPTTTMVTEFGVVRGRVCGMEP